MEIIIKGEPKEIAALVVAVQERQQKQTLCDMSELLGELNGVPVTAAHSIEAEEIIR